MRLGYVFFSGLCLIALFFTLSGCLLVAGVNAIRYDTNCEAYNSDVQRGILPGPIKVCDVPRF